MAGTMMDMNEIAAIMASQGVRTEEDTAPESIPEATIPAAAESAGSGETPTPTPEQAAAPTTIPEKIPEQAPTQQQPSASPADWKEELKKADITEVLKLRGFDDKTIGFINKWMGGGDINEYLRQASLDYSKMPAEEVMRHQLREEFPELSEEDFQLVYHDRVIEKYRLDPELFDERQRKLGQVLLNADAKKLRENYTAKQQEFILNSKPPAPSGPTLEQQAQQAQQTRNWYRSEVLKDPLAASVLARKEFTIGEGEEAFHFKVDNPDEIFDIVSDQQKMMSNIFTIKKENGQEIYYPNGEKNTLIGLVAKYGMSLFEAYGKHMRALGAGGTLELLENASKPGGTPSGSVDSELDPAAALAKFGQFNAG